MLLRRFLAAFLALVLALGAPLEVWTAPGDSSLCAIAMANAGAAGCCDHEASASGCSAVCPVGGAALAAENGHILGLSASIAPNTQPSSRPATQARAPDTAPPKRSVT